MPSAQTPNPFTAFIERIVSGARSLVGGRTFCDLVSALSSDRVIAGNGIDESPTADGRIWSVSTAQASLLPYAVSVYKEDSVWKIACRRNGGYFIDNWHYAHECIQDEDEEGIVEKTALPSDFLVCLRWEYSAYEDPGVENDPQLVVKAGTPESFDPFERPVTSADPSGVSLCLLASVHWEDADHPILTQHVRNNIRVFWALKDAQTLGQLGDMLSACKQKPAAAS